MNIDSFLNEIEKISQAIGAVAKSGTMALERFLDPRTGKRLIRFQQPRNLSDVPKKILQPIAAKAEKEVTPVNRIKDVMDDIQKRRVRPGGKVKEVMVPESSILGGKPKSQHRYW